MDTSAEPDKQNEEQEATADAVEVKTEGATKPAQKEEHSSGEPQLQQKKKRKGAKVKKNSKYRSLKQVSARFAACGRCSFFWAGYRVIFGEAGQETAVANNRSGWLDLEWNAQMRDLIFKSYGVRLDIDFYHYEGCCKECRRRFVYQSAEVAGENGRCSIEISPHEAK